VFAQELALDGLLGAYGLPAAMTQGCTTITRQVLPRCIRLLPNALLAVLTSSPI